WLQVQRQRLQGQEQLQGQGRLRDRRLQDAQGLLRLNTHCWGIGARQIPVCRSHFSRSKFSWFNCHSSLNPPRSSQDAPSSFLTYVKQSFKCVSRSWRRNRPAHSALPAHL